MESFIRFSVLVKIFCGFAVFGDFLRGFAVSKRPLRPPQETVCVDTIARKANSSCTRNRLVVFVTIRFSGVFVVPLYDYHNLFLI